MPNSVLYPSCGFDASPAKVFSNVTFVDIEDYTPTQKHDLLILLNPAISSFRATKHLDSF
jgi:hypothetical protein